MPAPRHVPPVTMVHPPEQAFSQMFAPIVPHDQHGRHYKREQPNDLGYPGFDHGNLPADFDTSYWNFSVGADYPTTYKSPAFLQRIRNSIQLHQ